MENLQMTMMEAQWARLAATRRPYRVLAPQRPGPVAYWMAMAIVADAGGRGDLAQASLDAAREAEFEAGCREIGAEYYANECRRMLQEVRGILARGTAHSAEDAARLIDGFLGGAA